uniref:Uncharacterized protein n=1 Tax=Anguilla anguilla TaxID=7936 RepID=A0A0E9Q5Q6_ANGAN
MLCSQIKETTTSFHEKCGL